MSRKRVVAPPPRACWPALVPWAALVAELVLASRKFWWTDAAASGHWLVLRGSAAGLAVAALALASSRTLRDRTVRSLDAPVSRPRLLAAFGGLFAWLFFLKYAQYRGFQLPRDTAASVNLCWNLIHGRGWRSPVYGVENHFAVHFIPLFALLSPLALVGGATLPFIAAQSLLIASIPLACFYLARRSSGSPLAGWLAFGVCAASPSFFDLAVASVYPGMYLSVFFVWAAALLETERFGWAALFLLLTLASIEQACLAAAGLALYWAVSRRRPWAALGFLMAGALFYIELRYKYSFPESARFRTWATFRNLGPTPRAALAAGLASPLETAAALVWPWPRVAPAARLLLSVGLLPFFAPLSLIPWAADFLPNFLADSGDIYHTIGLQYAGYVIGPLWFAAALGLARARAKVPPGWLAAGALALFAGDLAAASSLLQPNWSRNLFAEVPAAAAAIPAGESVWALEFAAPPLAARPLVKTIGDGFDAAFESGLFLPDDVLLDRGWPARADPRDRDRLLTLLGREGYRKVYEGFQLVVFRHPRAPLPETPLSLPEPGPQARAAASALERPDDPAGLLRAALATAERGDDYARFNAGLYLIQGAGAPKDEQAGLRLWSQAAEQGLAFAQGEYARYLFARQDFEGAARWFGAAARQGDHGAELNYGLLFALGKGVPQDKREAIRWFRRAAESGMRAAQYNLGIVLLDVDRAEAVSWLTKAADAGDPEARKRLERLGR